MQSTNNYISLNNGTRMPKIGYGIFRMTDEKECEEVVFQALNAGLVSACTEISGVKNWESDSIIAFPTFVIYPFNPFDWRIISSTTIS